MRSNLYKPLPQHPNDHTASSRWGEPLSSDWAYGNEHQNQSVIMSRRVTQELKKVKHISLYWYTYYDAMALQEEQSHMNVNPKILCMCTVRINTHTVYAYEVQSVVTSGNTYNFTKTCSVVFLIMSCKTIQKRRIRFSRFPILSYCKLYILLRYTYI